MTSTKIVRKPAALPKSAKSKTAHKTLAVSAAEMPAPKSEAELNGKAQHAEANKSKHKLVRDSFTIPKSEYTVLEGLKIRAADLKRPTKKSEMLRAGIAALHGMTDKAFLSALNSVSSLKTGRPKSPEAPEQSAKKLAE
jgi:hypothetical protein